MEIAVFGSSDPVEGEPLYETARRVGALLAASGYGVVTGGYGGVMEGASRGALEAGGRTTGVVCSIFTDRRPCRYLTETVETATLHDRMRTLVERASAYVVLWGKSGTLAEAALVWALQRAGSLDARPVILLGDSWGRLLGHLAKEGMLDAHELRTTRVVLSPEEVVPALRELPGDPVRR
jgi:uncharacterized protein (TIGR00730 family)